MPDAMNFTGDPKTSPCLPMFQNCTVTDTTLSGHVWNGTTDELGYFTGTCIPIPDEPDRSALKQRIRILEAKERMLHDRAGEARRKWKKCLDDLTELRIDLDELEG